MDEETPIKESQEEKGNGLAIVFVIVLVLILAAFFFFISTDRAQEYRAQSDTSEEHQVDARGFQFEGQFSTDAGNGSSEAEITPIVSEETDTSAAVDLQVQ